MHTYLVHFVGDIGAKVVAEGVERDADAEAASRLGVTLMQGHLFGRPVQNPRFTAKSTTPQA